MPRDAVGRPSPSRGAGAFPAVLHVVAHAADALTVTGPELQRVLREPGRPLAIVVLADNDPVARKSLLGAFGGSWDERGERLPGGAEFRVYTSVGAPHIRVWFPAAAPKVAPGAPDALVDCVAELLEIFSPGMVCTLDPDPEHIGRGDEPVTYPDHPEHAAVAQAVLEAVHRGSEPGEERAVVLECFRAAGPCGDLGTPRAAVTRYPGRRIWLTRGSDGRLTAYAALGGGLARWTQKTAGGPEWGEREFVPTPSLLPVLSVAQTPDGWIHLFSLRRTPLASGAAKVEIMHAVQYQSGRPLSPWRSLGNPNGANADKGREIGVPVAVVDGDGNAHVYARNFGRGVSARTQKADGSWTRWKDLQGSMVGDALATVLDDQGRPELYAATPNGVLRWQPDGKGAPARSPHILPLLAEPGSALTALSTGPGRITVYGCDARGGQVCAHHTDGAAGAAIGGAGGQGVTAIRVGINGYDCTVLVQRSAEGETAVAAYQTGHEADGVWWEKTGDKGVREPAVAVDAHGLVVVASLGGDGRLRVARQEAAGSRQLLGQWAAV